MLRLIAAAAAAIAAAMLALPAAAGANPAVSVAVVSTTNLTRTPATVVHRLTLSAGAQDEELGVVTAGGTPTVGGSAVLTAPTSAVPAASVTCGTRWSALHDVFDRVSTRLSLRIPAGTSGWVDLPVQINGRPYPEDVLDAEFEIAPSTGATFTVRSSAPAYTGPVVPDMTLHVIRGARRSTVITGQAPGVGAGIVEIWAYPPRGDARRLKTVRTEENGTWSWAGWRPTRRGTWEIHARWRRTARAPRTGSTACGVPVPVS